MTAQVSLYNLVDLALCDPEVGAVNFNHLRTLLLAILRLTNTTDSFVEKDSSINNDPDLVPIEIAKSVENTENESKEVKTVVKLIDHNLLKNRDVENRISKVEALLTAGYQFPGNEVILNNDSKTAEDGESKTFTTQDGSEVEDKTQLRTIWKNKRCLKRLDGVEEAIDKLFSLINDLLHKDKEEASSPDDYVVMKNPLAEMQTKLDEYIRQSNEENEASIAKNNLINAELLKKVDSLNKRLNENGSTIRKNSGSIETVRTDLGDLKGTENNKFEVMNSQLTNLTENVNNIMKELDRKIDKGNLPKQPLEPKNESTDLLGIYCDINQLTKSVEELQSKHANIPVNNGSNQFDEKLGNLEQDFKQFVEKTDAEIHKLEEELSFLKQGLDNISDGKIAGIMESLQNLSPINEIQKETNEMKSTIDDILKQLELQRNKLSSNEAMINSISQAQYETAPPVDLDTSVLAAIQHLAQENRQQITGIHENIKMLQKLQMPIITATPTTDNKESMEMIEVLQNHLLILQEEQSKLSGHMANMFDDYKIEFQRKQLHIDALYDYIEKLQKEKANREDIELVEMNIKDHKQALDNRVNLTTFDERYYRLEVALQQALSRLDQYVEEENSLKNELLKLSEDMSSKMDSDAGKQLKKFLDERLKAIQTARTNLPSGRDIRENAAGIRRPMPIHYNCISCDRTIDATQKGLTASIPYNLPSRSPLVSSQREKRFSTSSYNSVAANRPCGGMHTSVNVNSLRMMKVNPLATDYAVQRPNTVDITPTFADGVVGRDGQIYRGRLPTMDSAMFEQNKRTSGRNKSRVIHSARSTKSNDSLGSRPSGDRPYSAVLDEEKVDREKPLYLPMINDTANGHS